MNWQEILIILVPILGLMGWVYNRLDKRFDLMMNEIRDLRKDIQSLDTRVSRIEGQLTGVYHWEPRFKEEK